MVVETFVSSVLGVSTKNISVYLKNFHVIPNSVAKALHLSSKTTVSDHDVVIKRPPNEGETTEMKISVSEANMVIKRLGICHRFDEDKKKYFESEIFEGLFGEEEPCLEEIWEVFKVFDENKDGFIDAAELGRVLCSLGFLKEGSDFESCKKMISGFDRNYDGLLDFSDFLKFMDTCLY